MGLLILIIIILLLRSWWKSTEYPEWKEWTLEEWLENWDRDGY